MSGQVDQVPGRRHAEPEWALVTVAFVDIRDFTAFADRATAREAVAYLNEFFEVTVPIVSEHGGTVNQVLGDGFLAVFSGDDHAGDALTAGGRLLEAVEGGFGERCKIGVGLNSGLVLVGTIAAGVLNHPGVIGDPVNVAARVEAATRDLDVSLLLTEGTRVLLHEDRQAELEPHGALSLKGKGEPVTVYGLGEHDAARNAARTPAAYKARHERAIDRHGSIE
jgi:adenylate cyclase